MSTVAVSYNKSVAADRMERKGIFERFVSYLKNNQETIVLGMNTMGGRCDYPYGRNK